MSDDEHEDHNIECPGSTGEMEEHLHDSMRGYRGLHVIGVDLVSERLSRAAGRGVDVLDLASPPAPRRGLARVGNLPEEA